MADTDETDLVARLRRVAPLVGKFAPLLEEAAAEIARLRAEVVRCV
jgi:hypothetical protein